MIDQVFAQEDAAGIVSWLLTDHLGTVRDLVDDGGTVVNHITYDSFGNVSAQSRPAATTRFLFTGRELDPETGLYYYRARYYDPRTGRFVSADPIQFSDGTNFYRAVGNNPASFRDPWGLTEEPGDGGEDLPGGTPAPPATPQEDTPAGPATPQEDPADAGQGTSSGQDNSPASYATARDAARAALGEIFRQAMAEGVEYGGVIYRNPDGSYSYTTARTDNDPMHVDPWVGQAPGDVVAYYHTHPVGLNFSQDDYDYADQQRINAYVATRLGNVLEYDRATGDTLGVGKAAPPIMPPLLPTPLQPPVLPPSLPTPNQPPLLP
jgi:RHS repeat-associated protein